MWKKMKTGFSFALIIVMASGLLSGCSMPGGGQGSGSNEAQTGESSEADNEIPEETIEKVLNGEGTVTTFIADPPCDGVIRESDDAYKAVCGMLPSLGGDKTTELIPYEIQPTENGVTYYIFHQTVGGDLKVNGAAVKLIVDKDGKAVGVVSSILPNLKAPDPDAWLIDEKKAEEVVRECYPDAGIRIKKDATEQTLLPFEDGSGDYYYAWVVYTNNLEKKADTAYMAHYVDCSGEYLYSMPVSAPGSYEAQLGSEAEFAFDSMESDTWKGTVKTLSGEKMDIEIPVMKDPESGLRYLGDVKRKILCADQNDFENNETLTPSVEENGKWEDEAAITYYNFIRVYDFFAECGWDGPDGRQTPTLLLMDWVDEEGYPAQNACYTGSVVQGFQVFDFDTQAPYGESMDVVGHEFTHCYTDTAMTGCLYKNDYGAINEGMSDIFGNLIAMILDENDVHFVIGETLGDGLERYMGYPHKSRQPGFAWDRFYVPAVVEMTDRNDNGGVHQNSSLLNIFSYRLNEAGMSPEDQLYYWMNVANAMTPRTDFNQLGQLMPWVMKTSGYKDYVGVIEKTVRETGILGSGLPGSPAKGLGIVSVRFPKTKGFETYEVLAVFTDTENEDRFVTWPEAGTNRISAALPEGKYTFRINLLDEYGGKSVHLHYQDHAWQIDEEINAGSADGDWDECGDHYEYDGDAAKYGNAPVETAKENTVLKVESGTKLMLDGDPLVKALESIR